jgi:hypothetical protein
MEEEKVRVVPDNEGLTTLQKSIHFIWETKPRVTKKKQVNA